MQVLLRKVELEDREILANLLGLYGYEFSQSVYFWNNVINEYMNGKFEMVEAYPNTEYEDGTLAGVFFFDNSLHNE